MVNFIIILLLLFGFLRGLKRGFILQVFHLIGFIISFLVASISFKKLSAHLELWVPFPAFTNESLWADALQSTTVQDAFYNGVSFVLIFFVTKFVLQIIASMLDFVASFPILYSFNKLFGSLLGFLEIYFVIFILLFFLSLTPIEAIQSGISQSFIAKTMIQETPLLTKRIQELWFVSLQTLIRL